VTSSLDGKVAIITGAAHGIGAATARSMVLEGAKVVLADLDQEKIVRLAEKRGPDALALSTDVTNEGSVARLVESAFSRYSMLDILHNNAVAPSIDDVDFEFAARLERHRIADRRATRWTPSGRN
jgi:NADP-dependent 3-hydroxy acid dehydrogenase YdfG